MKTEAAQVAAIIRKQLRAHNIDGRVTSSNYSMGNSVNVSVTDLAPWTLAALTSYCGDFQSGSFDGMTDSYTYNRDRTGPTAKYVHVSCSYSDHVRQAAYSYLRGWHVGFEDAPATYDDARNTYLPSMNCYVQDAVYRVLNGTLGQFWKKPHTRTAPAVAAPAMDLSRNVQMETYALGVAANAETRH